MDNLIVLTESQLRVLVTEAVEEALAQYLPARSNPELMTDETLTVKEAAAYLGVSTSTVRQLIREKRLPFSRVRGQYFAKKWEIDSWVRDGRAGLDEGEGGGAS